MYVTSGALHALHALSFRLHQISNMFIVKYIEGLMQKICKLSQFANELPFFWGD